MSADFFSEAQIEEAKTSELVEFFNLHNPEKQIKKFADRATAVKRCIALLATINREDEDAEDEVPAAPAAPVVSHQPSAGVVSAFASAESMSQSLSEAVNNPQPSKPVVKAPPAPKAKDDGWLKSSRVSNSAGVAASWADPEVQAARLTRHGVQVEVNGNVSEFKSVRDAFREHRLPDSKHIRFRLALKAAKVATFENDGKKYNFTLVEKA